MYFLVVSLKCLLKFACLYLAPTIPVCHRPAIPFYLPSGLTHSSALLARCPQTAEFETQRQHACRYWQGSMEGMDLPWACFLDISFYHHHLKISGTGCFSFLFGLIFFFFKQKKEDILRLFFPLMLEFIFYLYFSSIWKLTSDHLLGMETPMRKASAMRNVITFLLIIILSSLILVLQPPFIEILFIGRDIFLASPLSILQFWTFSKLFSEAESLLGVIFFPLPSFSSN